MEEVAATIAPAAEVVVEAVAENVPFSVGVLIEVLFLTVFAAFSVELVTYLLFCFPVPYLSDGTGMLQHKALTQKTREYELLDKKVQGEAKPKQADIRKREEMHTELEELHQTYSMAKMKSTIAGTLIYFGALNYAKRPYLGKIVGYFPFHAIWPLTGMLQQGLIEPTARHCAMMGIFMMGMQFFKPIAVDLLHLTVPVKPVKPEESVEPKSGESS